jgi:hypothetical protein
MSVISDFYVTETDRASDYDVDQKCHPDDRVQYSNITSLELSILWAIIQGQEWDVKMMKDFPAILVIDDGERVIQEFSQSVIERLAVLSQDEIATAAEAWAQTEEIRSSKEDILPVVTDLVRLAKRAQASNRHLFLWNCV